MNTAPSRRNKGEAKRLDMIIGCTGFWFEERNKPEGKSTAAFYLEIWELTSKISRNLMANPKLALSGKRGLIIIDEIQHRPELFPALRVLVDRPDNAARFLLLGSASPMLVRGVSETLAGRTSFVDMAGFTLEEVVSGGSSGSAEGFPGRGLQIQMR